MNAQLKKRGKEILGGRDVSHIYNIISFIIYKIPNTLVVRYHYTILNVSRFFWKPDIVKESKSRNKPHVLIITEKWFECNPAKGRSSTEHNLIGSLESAGLATQDQFYYDEYCLQYNRPCDAALLQICLDSKPDFLFFSQPNVYSPKWETLGIIRKKLGIPVAAIWWDYLPVADYVLPYVDLNVVLQSVYLKETRHPEKYLLMWTSYDQKIFFNPDIPRDINISFAGDKTKPDRQKGISALIANGVDIYQSEGVNGSRLSTEDYAHIHMRSKIVLNFSRGGYWSDDPHYRIHHAKGRIFEATLCGAMLLESENPETRIWFEPSVDYVPFTDENDLVEKAKYYIDHDIEREKIAANGHRKATEMYTSERFWKLIFERIFKTDPKKQWGIK